MTTIQDRFRLRRGTAAALTAANEIPLAQEIVIESDTELVTGKRKFKIGDGTTHWNDLPYFTVATSGGGGSDGDLYTAVMADSPSLYWRCNESSGTTLADSAGGGHNMTLRGTNVLHRAELLDGGGSLLFPFSGTSANGARTADLAGVTVPVNYDHTLMAVWWDTGGANGYIRTILELSGAGETEDANMQTRLSIFGSTNDFWMQQLWEAGAGVNYSVDGPTIPRGVPLILHARKTAATKTIDQFVNGRHLSSGTYTTEPTGGSAGVWAIGNTPSGTVSTSAGIVSNCAFFASALSDARIKAHAQAAGLY